MVSKKQWVLIGLVAIVTATGGASSPAAAAGGAVGGGLIAYGIVAGYNGRDLWGEFKQKLRVNDD